MAETIHTFSMPGMRNSGFWGRKRASWPTVFSAPKVQIPTYANAVGKAKVEIKMGKDLVIQSMEVDCSKGLKYLPYNLSVDAAIKGQYVEMLNKKKR